jgi:hypothetical protein
MKNLQETTYSRAMKEMMQEKMDNAKHNALSTIESYQRNISRQKERLQKDLHQLVNDPAYTDIERSTREKELKFTAELYIIQQEGIIQQQQNIIAFIEQFAHRIQA